jgi:hypothetical protein
LQNRRVITGDVGELRPGEAFLPGRNGKPSRYGYGKTKARGRKDRPEAPDWLPFLLTSDRSGMRRLASLVRHLRLRRRQGGEELPWKAGAEGFRPFLQMP